MAVRGRRARGGTGLGTASLDSSPTRQPRRGLVDWTPPVTRLLHGLHDVLATPQHRRYWWLVGGLLGLEIILNLALLWRVPYTEIDWRAYMQEVEGFLRGTVDYAQLRGDTGPLVYPAGFVYIYSLLYSFTDQGRAIFRAQCLFYLLYLASFLLAAKVYSYSRQVKPAWLLLLLCSKRIRSIFYLRLFNDPLTAGACLLAVWAILARRYHLANAAYALALSIKMSVLLYLPGFMLLQFQALGFPGLAASLLTIPTIQVLLAFPFWPHWRAYLAGAFDFGRTFLYTWTVNWKFLPERLFLHPTFHAVLLLLHLTVLLAFLLGRWCLDFGGLLPLLRVQTARLLGSPKARRPTRAEEEKGKGKQPMYYRQAADLDSAGATHPDPDHVLAVLFTCNLVGIACSRSLHYQFYAWYFYTLPYLLGRCRGVPWLLRVTVFAGIEACWNVFPATPISSAVLLAGHVALLAACFWLAPS